MANCWPSFKLSSHTELDLLVAWCCVSELYIKKRIDVVSVSCLTSHHQQHQSVANCFIRIVCYVCPMIGCKKTAVCTSSFLRFGDELSEIGTKLKLPVPWLRGFMRRWGFSPKKWYRKFEGRGSRMIFHDMVVYPFRIAPQSRFYK